MKYKVGVIAGCFDVMHAGYAMMFKEAAEICEKIVVFLQDDPTLERPEKLKPVQSWDDRKEILSCIRGIDRIIKYETEKQLYEFLTSIDFDVRILGDDYRGRNFTGDDINKPVHFCSRSHNFSATNLKKKINQEFVRRNLKRHMSTEKLTYVFDIDGTLLTETGSKYENAKPIDKAVRKVNALFDRGHKILLMTARGASSGIDHSELTERQMKEFGIKFHQLIMNKKPTADIFVDDKAMNAIDWLELNE